MAVQCPDGTQAVTTMNKLHQQGLEQQIEFQIRVGCYGFVHCQCLDLDKAGCLLGTVIAFGHLGDIAGLRAPQINRMCYHVAIITQTNDRLAICFLLIGAET